MESKVDKVLSISTFANIFVLGHFSVHRKDWLTYSDGTENIVKQPDSNGQLPAQILDSHSPALLNVFLPSDHSVFSALAFPPL